MTRQKKITLSVLLMVVASLMIGGWLDSSGQNYTEEGLKRTLVTYAIARGLNGIISVAQGTEVAVEPVGVGVTFTPGQILDPINDLVERFSWIVLASGVSLGAQNVLLGMTSWLWFGLAVGVFLVISLITVWNGQFLTPKSRQLVYKATLILVILRLAVPLIAILNQGIYQVFLEPQFEESKAQLEQTTTILEASPTTPVLEPETEGFIDSAKQFINSASNAMNINQQLEELKQVAAEISEYVLNLIVVFVLQTLVFPLLFLWLTYRLVIAVIQYQPARNPDPSRLDNKPL
jgi:hypothetical protein